MSDDWKINSSSIIIKLISETIHLFFGYLINIIVIAITYIMNVNSSNSIKSILLINKFLRAMPIQKLISSHCGAKVCTSRIGDDSRFS